MRAKGRRRGGHDAHTHTPRHARAQASKKAGKVAKVEHDSATKGAATQQIKQEAKKSPAKSRALPGVCVCACMGPVFARTHASLVRE